METFNLVRDAQPLSRVRSRADERGGGRHNAARIVSTASALVQLVKAIKAAMRRGTAIFSMTGNVAPVEKAFDCLAARPPRISGQLPFRSERHDLSQ